MTAVAIGIGRFMTPRAIRCHLPSPAGFARRFHSLRLSTLRPMTASNAGRNTTAPRIATRTTETPA